MGDGASSQDILRRQFIQRSLATATAMPSTSFDPLDPDSISAQQRAARSMREGLNSSFGTSTRGTDSAKGSGLQGPQDDPIISAPTVGSQPGTNAIDDGIAKQNANDSAIDGVRTIGEGVKVTNGQGDNGNTLDNTKKTTNRRYRF